MGIPSSSSSRLGSTHVGSGASGTMRSMDEIGSARREGMHRSPLEPDVILAARFLPQALETPEKRLLLAVLEEAVGTYQRYAGATDLRSRALFAEVDAWLGSEDTAWLYSFVGICDAIGLDATYLRSGLRLWLEALQGTSPEADQPPYRFPFRRVGGTRHRANGRAAGMPRRA
jgi:hypothetical protein